MIKLYACLGSGNCFKPWLIMNQLGNAMIWYLAEGSQLMPKAPAERAEALQWMFFEQSKLEPLISPARFFTTILPAEKENRADDIARWQEAAEAGLARLDAHLATRSFILASGYSIADIAVFGYVHVLEEAGLKLADFPAIANWIGRVCETDGYVPLSNLGSTSGAAA